MLARKLILPILLFILSLNVAAQHCNCSQILGESIKGVEENYALFKLKVNAQNEAGYRAFNQIYLEKAKAINQSASCQQLLNKWVSYFNDKHLWITMKSQDEKVSYIRYDLKFKSYRIRWQDPSVAKDPIEGLWEMEGYRAAIIPDPTHYGHFNAIIVSADNDTFRPGMLKMHLSKRDGYYDMDFYRRDSTLAHSTIRLTSKHTLIDDDDINWRRLEPINATEKVPSLSELALVDRYRPTLKWLDEKSVLFTMPNCAPRYGKVVDSLINAHKEKIGNCENLILDVRGNGGGSDRTYRALLPYILTKASPQPRVGYYLSEENVKMFRELGILQKLNPKDTVQRGTWATMPNTPYVSAAYYAASPRQVAILMDAKTASSGETFVLKSKTSERVTTFGTATAGCIDGYNGIVIDLTGASLRYPTSIRTLNLPYEAIDPFGILPDVPIAKNEADPISFIKAYLTKVQGRSN